MAVKTDVELKALATAIHDQATLKGNTKEMVGDLFTNFADSKVNVASLPYKSYTILLSLSGGGYTVIVLQNTIGDGSGDGINDFIWSDVSNGRIRATMSSATFGASKVIAFTSGLTPYMIDSSYGGSGRINFDIVKFDGTQTATPFFNNLGIEIRVYN